MISHKCPSCSTVSVCNCKICKKSPEQIQLCIKCFKKLQALKNLNKKVIDLARLTYHFDTDFGHYLDIYEMLDQNNMSRLQLPSPTQKLLERLEEHFDLVMGFDMSLYQEALNIYPISQDAIPCAQQQSPIDTYESFEAFLDRQAFADYFEF